MLNTFDFFIAKNAREPRTPRNQNLGVLGSLALLAIVFPSNSLGKSPASQATNQSNQEQVFEDQEHHCRLKYPSNWIHIDKLEAGQILSMHSQPISGKDSRIMAVVLRVERGPEKTEDHDALLQISGAIAGYAFNNGGKKVTIRPDRLGTIDGRRVRFDADSPSGAITTMYIVAVKDRFEYVFNIAAPAEKFDELFPAVAEMLKSFEFLE